MADANTNSHITELTADIVASYVANNPVSTADLPALIQSIYGTFSGLRNGTTAETPAERPKPAVSLRQAVQPDYVVDLFTGLKFKSLKRHLRTKHGMTPEEYRAYWRKVLKEDFHIRPRRASHGFTPGEIIDLGSCTAEIIHAPGHTPGFVAFFFREPAVLFMGDYDLTAFGPWYGDRAGSIDETIASVRRLQQVPAKVWLTSHEDGCFEGDVAPVFDRYLAVIDEREAKLLDLLAVPRTMEDIVAACIVYRKPREPKAFFEWGEGAIMGKHLDRLLGSGAIALEDGRYRRR